MPRTKNQATYPLWKALFMSFYSRALYKDVGRNWSGIGLKYIFLVSFITCVFLTTSWMRTLYAFDTSDLADKATEALFEDPSLTFEENLNRILNIVAQTPDVSLHDGAASIKDKETVIITDPASSKTLAVVDTTGTYATLKDADAPVLITRTRLIFKNSKDVEETINLSDLESDYGLKEDDINLYINTLSQVPLIAIINGKASIEPEQSPYLVTGRDNKPLLLIDLSGEVTSLDNTNATVLLTSDRLFVKNPLDGKISETYLEKIDADMIFTVIESLLNHMRRIISWMLPFFITPFFVVAVFAFSVIMAFFYGFIGMTMGRIFKMPPLPLAINMRLAAVAITPVIALNILVPHIFSNQGLIYFLIALGYIYFALKANAEG